MGVLLRKTRNMNAIMPCFLCKLTYNRVFTTLTYDEWKQCEDNDCKNIIHRNFMKMLRDMARIIIEKFRIFGDKIVVRLCYTNSIYISIDEGLLHIGLKAWDDHTIKFMHTEINNKKLCNDCHARIMINNYDITNKEDCLDKFNKYLVKNGFDDISDYIGLPCESCKRVILPEIDMPLTKAAR